MYSITVRTGESYRVAISLRSRVGSEMVRAMDVGALMVVGMKNLL
jgi:hypothetical protein